MTMMSFEHSVDILVAVGGLVVAVKTVRIRIVGVYVGFDFLGGGGPGNIVI